MMMRGRRVLGELDQQIRDHIEQETLDNVDRGMSPEEARRAALRKFGSVALAKEDARAVWIPIALEQLLQDLRFGCRILTKSPALSGTAALLMALVIGGNTTVFSIAHGILKKPAPGVQGAGLVMLNWVNEQGQREPATSYPNYQHITEQSSTLRPILAAQPYAQFTLNHDNGSYAISGSRVSRNYFDTIGVPFVSGRNFTEEENQAGASGVAAVISHRAWQDFFGGAPDVIGRSVFLNGHAATIVGVVAPEFRGTRLAESADVWVPLVGYARVSGEEHVLQDRFDDAVGVSGRLRPGASLSQADAEMAAIWAQLQAAHPQLKRLRVTLIPYSAVAGSGTGIDHGADGLLAILSIVTLLTLVIVCANVANLLLARAVVRQREMALRQSLGASRFRIIRMLLAEGLAISAIASCAALLFAWWVSRAASGLVELIPGVEAVLDFTPDWTVAGYAVVLAMVAVVAFTVAPAIRTWRLELLPWLKAGEQGVVHGRSGLSRGLVIVQLAFSVLLVTSAGLAYRSLFLVSTLDPGFDTQNLLLVTVNTAGGAASPGANAALLESLRERLHAVPGVERATYARLPLFRDGGWENNDVRIAASAEPVRAARNHVGPDYFQVLGVSTVAGREFAPQERARILRPAVISQSLASALWPGQSPLGRTVIVDQRHQTEVVREEAEVVGVVEDSSGFPREDRRVVFLSAQMEPAPPGEMTLYVRYTGSLDVVALAIRRGLREADARTPIVSMRTAHAKYEGIMWPVRFLTMLLTLFAGGSLLIAGIGQYAVISFDMRRRVREIGLRLALGASSQQVLTSVMREGFRLTGAGLAIGFGLSLAVGRGLGGVLYGITPTDSLTYAGVFAVLTIVSLLACYLPARRAARINPTSALRDE